MEQLTLRNGSTEPAPIVQTTMMALSEIMNVDTVGITALRDLYQLCLGTAGYQMLDPQRQLLDRYLLLDTSGIPKDSIRNIVLSAVQGEGLEMELVNPVVNPA